MRDDAGDLEHRLARAPANCSDETGVGGREVRKAHAPPAFEATARDGTQGEVRVPVSSEDGCGGVARELRGDGAPDDRDGRQEIEADLHDASSDRHWWHLKNISVA